MNSSGSITSSTFSSFSFVSSSSRSLMTSSVLIELHCCGAEGPEDWRLASWTKSDITHMGGVPSSCCIKNSKVSRFMGSGSLCGIAGSVLPGKAHPGVWNEGCGPLLIAKFQENMLILISAQFGLAVIQLLGLCFSFSLCCGMRRQSYGGYKS
ncbi:hypothetical protein LSAT2_014331 [Lamellibrachia satsuma]|nr:hypothetical protein LSAT2_014331 [Lamellibrachia satsuma]